MNPAPAGDEVALADAIPAGRADREHAAGKRFARPAIKPERSASHQPSPIYFWSGRSARARCRGVGLADRHQSCALV